MYTFLIIMGIVTYLIVMFSLLTGLRVVKVKHKVHKTAGILGFSCASVHGLMMLYFNFLT